MKSVELGYRDAGNGVRIVILDDRAFIEGRVPRGGRSTYFTYRMTKDDVELLEKFLVSRSRLKGESDE